MRSFLAVLVMLFTLSPLAAGADHSSRVLLISSYHPGFPSFFSQVDGLKSVLDSKNVDLDIEFMDAKRFNDSENHANFTRLLTYKLDHSPPYDVLVVADDNALMFAMEHKDSLFREVPVVFMGINDMDYAMNAMGQGGMTGVLENTSMGDTVQTMHRLLPKMDTIVVLTDATLSGQGDLKRIKQVLGMRNYRYEVIDLSLMQWDDYPALLRRVSPHDAMLLLAAFTDSRGVTKTFSESLEIILDNAPCPVFHLWKHGIGEGLVGGKVISFAEHGRLAGKRVLEIIRGESLRNLPVISSVEANPYIFDANVLSRYGMDAGKLPEGSILLNDRPNFISRNMGILLQAGAVILLLMAFISHLLRVNRAKTKAERATRKSEKKYRTYIEGAPDAIIVCDAQGVLLEANPAAARLTGYERSELMGMSLLTSLVPPRHRPHAAGRFAELRRTASVSIGLEILRKDGEAIYILLDVVRLDEKSFIGFCKDLTEQKRTHDALEKSEKLFRDVLEQAGDAIFIFDRSGSLQFVNESACSSLGYTHEELLQLRMWEVDPITMERNDPETVWTQPSIRFETTQKRKDGSTFPVEMRMGRISVGGEELVLGMARDISDEQEKELETQRVSQLAQAQAEIVRALIAPNGTIQEVARVVYEWTQRITGGKFAYVGSVEPSEHGLFIYNNTAMQGMKYRDGQPQIILPKGKDGYPSLWGHSLNTGKGYYTNNAPGHPKSTGLPEGHFPVQQFLSMPCRYEGELVGQIGVANPDRDFTDADLKGVELLAELFALAVYRKRTEFELIKARECVEAANRSRNLLLADINQELKVPLDVMTGTLELVRNLGMSEAQTTYMDSVISSSSNMHKVIDTLLDKDTPAEDKDCKDMPRKESASDSCKCFGKLRILLAEDDRINRLATRRLLEKQGHRVDEVEDGKQAVEALANAEYDCILMDIQMPVMDGVEATRTIRRSTTLGSKKDTPIIALTAHAMKDDRKRFLEAGMNDYLAKPMDIDILISVLAHVLPQNAN